MAKVTLDLKDYKHVKSDGYTTTLRHKHGHEIRIAHKMLDKDTQSTLQAIAPKQANPKLEESKKTPPKAMAEGGDVDAPLNAPTALPVQKQDMASSPMATPPNPSLEETLKLDPQQAQQWMDQIPMGMAGTVEKFATSPEAAAAMGNGMGSIKQVLPQLEQMKDALLSHLQSGKATPEQVQKISDMLFGSITKKAEGGRVQYAKGTPNSVVDDSGYASPQEARDMGRVDQEVQQATQFQMPQSAIEGLKNKDPNANYKDLFNNTVQELQQANADSLEAGTHPRFTRGDNILQIAADKALSTKEADKAEILQKQAAITQQQAQKDALSSKLAQIGVGPNGINSQSETAAPPLPQGPSEMPQQPSQMGGGIPGMSGDYESMLKGGYNQALQGLQQEATAKTNLGNIQAEQLRQQQDDQMKAKNAYQSNYDAINQERMAHIEDIKNGYIDPEKYWTGMKDPKTGEMKGGHSKIMSAIGLILGGFNPTNNPNAAIDMLKYQMNQNIDAQKANLNSNQNLLAANLRQFGNMRDATDMTRIMQNDMMVKQLQESAAKAQGPMAKAQILQTAGKLQMEMPSQLQPFAMRRAIMGMSGPGDVGSRDQMLSYIRMTQPEVAKQMEAHIIPGVPGTTTVPVTEDMRKKLMARDQLHNAATDLMSFVKQHQGDMTPSAKAQGAIKARLLQSLYREGVLNTVYREGEQPLLNQVVDQDPLSVLNYFTEIPKLQEVIAGNQRGKMGELKSLGLNVPGMPSQGNTQQAKTFKPRQ